MPKNLLTNKNYFVIIYLAVKSGLVVQLVRTLACHARGQGFESPSGRHFADMAQLVEHILGKDEVPSSNLGISSIETE